MTGEFSGPKDDASLAATLPPSSPVNDHRRADSDMVPAIVMPDGSDDVPTNPRTQNSSIALADGTPDVPAAASAPTHPGQEDAPAALEPTRTSQPDSIPQDPTHTSAPDRPAAQDPTRTSQPGPATAATLPSIQPRSVVPQVRNPARYHHLGEHGRGGLGKVSRAHDLELGRDVAIKELLSRSAIHEVRFMREALITARLEHPGIVPVHEAGRWPDGTPFYAMKLVAGRPLRDLLAERKTVDERLSLLHHVIAVADAIAYAHGRNIIHRDLKPANVIVGDFGETVVIDWGLAKDLSGSEESTSGTGSIHSNRDADLTSAGAILGTPAYMAPEQRRGEPVDQRVDVYAIGAMLWELCSLERLPAIYHRQHRRILGRAGIDPDLITIVEKALATDPEHRYADAGALALDLKSFKTGERIRARRYSPGAVIAHWIRRHRLLTVSSVLAIALTLIAAMIYVRTLTTERDRTHAALKIAEFQKRQAIIATATALVERDPTRAWAALEILSDDAQDTAAIRARIKATGVAEARIPLPASLDRILPTPNRQQLIVSSREDRSLYAIDLKTLKLRRLARDMTTPSIFSATDTHVYAVQNTGHLVFSKISISSGISEAICDIHQLPDDLMVGDAGLFWQTPDGLLFQLKDSQKPRVIASNVAQFSITEHGPIICTRQHLLYILDPMNQNTVSSSLGYCKETQRWADRDGAVAIFKDNKTILIFNQQTTGRKEPFQLISLDNDNIHSFLALSTTGVLSAVDSEGNGAILKPQSSQFERIHLRQQPIGTTAGQDRIGWAFQNGDVKVLDSKTNQEWSIRAHATRARCLFFISDNQLLTCESNELRLWHIPSNAPRVIATLPSPVFHIAVNTGQKLLDTENGDVYLSSDDFLSITLLHRHTKLAYGVDWCDEKACSASWDGNIVCRSSGSVASEVIASFGVPIRAFFGRSGHCFAAVSNGDIYDLRALEHPLYRHDDEPNRLAMSMNGTQLASTDWNGSVKIWSISDRHQKYAIERLHNSRITGIAWTDDDKIVTAGLDGMVYLLNSNLTISRQWRFPVAALNLILIHDTVYIAFENGEIHHFALTEDFHHSISLGVAVRSFDVSASQGHIAVGSEDGEIFIIDDHWRVAAKRFDGGAIQCVIFETSGNLLACVHDGRIFRIDMMAQSIWEH